MAADLLGGQQISSDSMSKPLADRRSQVRFDVVGTLYGLLETTETTRVLNISPQGALVDSPLPAPLDSTQLVRFVLDDEPLVVDARVRHLGRTRGEEGVPCYLIGLEFVPPLSPVPPSLERVISDAIAETKVSGDADVKY
jgi:PilZ domain